MKNVKVSEILMIMNSSDDLGFKYPIGNVPLMERVKALESSGQIFYTQSRKWVKGKGIQ